MSGRDTSVLVIDESILTAELVADYLRTHRTLDVVGFVDAGEVLLGEIVDHEAVVALEGLDETVVVVAAVEREAGEDQPRRPTFGAFEQ